jgi:hypothetical protein
VSQLFPRSVSQLSPLVGVPTFSAGRCLPFLPWSVSHRPESTRLLGGETPTRGSTMYMHSLPMSDNRPLTTPVCRLTLHGLLQKIIQQVQYCLRLHHQAYMPLRRNNGELRSGHRCQISSNAPAQQFIGFGQLNFIQPVIVARYQ